jgi:predicted membrane channel-forming protein YqfA (hemolysin III family)
MEDDETAAFSRELIEFLNELRVILPGVQVLFAFLLGVPFAVQSSTITETQRSVYFVAFLASAAACAFLMAPSLYHRLHWRRDVRDKEEMLRTFNRLAIVGGTLLAISMTCTIFVVTDRVFGEPHGAIIASASACVFLALWFALPLSRKQRDKKR